MMMADLRMLLLQCRCERSTNKDSQQVGKKSEGRIWK
ncbi:hypothetical protein P3T21_004564 [Paraburkholderia sp. GAS334]